MKADEVNEEGAGRGVSEGVMWVGVVGLGWGGGNDEEDEGVERVGEVEERVRPISL